MTIRLLKTFIAVASHGTLAAAAREVGLTQAAVSIQMRGLEEHLHAKLFDRTGRAVALSAAGRDLVPRAREVVALYDNLAVGASDKGVGGLLTLGAIAPTFLHLLPDALLELRSRHPAVVVRVVTGVSSELTAKVERGDIDAALVAEPPGRLSRTLSWQPVFAEPLVLLTPRDLEVKALRETLAETPFIGINKIAWTGRLIQSLLRRHRVRVNEVMELDSIETIRGMVARGFGVSILPLHPSRWGEDPRVNVALLEPQASRSIGVIELEAHARMQLTSALRACLKGERKTKTPKVRRLSFHD
jgi:DNA-binding transcriptional LysR family regulator